jgi:hypothetical protein
MARTGRPKREGAPRLKTSIVVPEALWVRLKEAAVEERRDVSSILCQLAEAYLKTRKGGRR